MTNIQTMAGKVYTVTGAASGIGLAVAISLASRGATLSLADINAGGLQNAQQQITESHPATVVKISAVDIRKRDQVAAWISTTKEKFGKIDGCVNCAGVVVAGTAADIPNVTEEALDEVIDINLKGTFNCLWAEIPSVVDGASIVNTSSMAGLTAVPLFSPYCASKYAVIGLTKTAAKENAARGIRVNAVCPGITETPLLSTFLSGSGITLEQLTARQLFKRVAKVEEVAAMIVFLLSDESSFITGESHRVGGGWDV